MPWMSSRARAVGPDAAPSTWSESVEEFLKLVMPVDRLLDFFHRGIGIGAVIARRFDGVPQDVVAQFLVIRGARVVGAMAPDRIYALRRLFGEIAHVGF